MNQSTLVGTVWRDSNHHQFTVTSVEPDTTRPDEDRLIAHGVTANCTPGVCPWSHEGRTSEIYGTRKDLKRGKTFGWQRQDVFDADPHRPDPPQVTDLQRRIGLEMWAGQAAMATPNSDLDAINERMLRTVLGAEGVEGATKADEPQQ